MTPVECEFEAEVLAAAVQERWPDRVDAQLRDHVLTCQICSDVVAIGGVFDEAREELRAAAIVPDSGRMWWLARMRARREAARAAARPINVVQVAAFACAVALLGACFGATSTWFQTALQAISSSVADSIAGGDTKSFVPLLMEHGALAAGVAALLLLVPAIVYLALEKD